MKKLAKIITTASLAILLAAYARPVLADGLTVSADKESCEIGDKITVSVDAQSIGDGTVPPDIQVEFNANRLNFENCSVEYGGGGGGLVTFKDKSATVEFTTLSGGNADVKVTATADDAASPETASVTIAVNGEDTAAAMDENLTSGTGVAAGTVDAGDGRVVQTVFADEFKPVLFHKETCDYKGTTVECAKFDMGDITLLYTTDASGADGKFMMYDAASGEMSEVRMIQGIENRFIIVLADCEGPIPEGYTKAVLDWNGQTLTAFMEESVAAGAAATVDGVNPADFFLVYAMSSEGNKGWYRYDKNEGTYQRFINTAGEASQEGNESASDEGQLSGMLDEYIPGDVQSILLIALAPLALILLIAVIILAVKVHDYAEDLDAFYEDYYADEEEDEDEDDEEEVYERRPARPGAVTAASLVGKSMSEDEAEDEDEDEEEAEEDDREDEDEEDVRINEPEDEDEDEDEDDVKQYRPLTRKERKELEREEKWRLKEEKKAATRRAQGYEEATPMDWSTFEKSNDDAGEKAYAKSKPPKYMTESMEPIPEEEEAPKKAPLPPRKKVVAPEYGEETARAPREEDTREKQRRLFEQQQRIEEQRRIEKEKQEEEARKQQQQFIESKTEDLDLDEDFQFEFLNLS